MAKGKSRTSTKQMGDVDVRDPSHVAELEKLLKSTKVVVILVYADWCGHCHTYRDGVWSKLNAIPNKSRKAGLAAIQAEQLKHTPFANAKLQGYPSILLVGEDGLPAEFKDDTGKPTNALPDARNEAMMNKLVTTDPSTLPDEGTKVPVTVGNGTKLSSTSIVNAADSMQNNAVLPPNPEDDVVATNTVEVDVDRTLVPAKGGSLYHSLVNLANPSKGPKGPKGPKGQRQREHVKSKP
jgi:thiol-disulfide isomerase/thioredoxin